MTAPAARWAEVGEKLDALGAKLKTHFEQSGDTGEVGDAFQKIKVAFAEAVESAGNALRDDAVKADLKETGRLFVDALSASFAKVSENMKTDTTPPADAPKDPQLKDPPPQD